MMDPYAKYLIDYIEFPRRRLLSRQELVHATRGAFSLDLKLKLRAKEQVKKARVRYIITHHNAPVTVAVG